MKYFAGVGRMDGKRKKAKKERYVNGRAMICPLIILV